MNQLETRNRLSSAMFPRALIVLLIITVCASVAMNTCEAAYNHGEINSGNFTSAYPDKVGTKLDSCYLCHSGGSYVSNNKTTNLGSCQWCHYKFGYDESGDINDTLNPYGKDYRAFGKNKTSFGLIENLDSDGDNYSNKVEIDAIRYPGDPGDDPSKVPAPYRVFTRGELEKMPQHTQFMLMNRPKSTDFYARYSGVALENLLQPMLLGSATGIKVYSPDGFSTYHPLNPDPNPKFYHVFGIYPAASFYYNETADIAKNPDGWVDYSSPFVLGRQDGDPINNRGGLKMLLAIKRDGTYLDTGFLNDQNQLDGEGPFRIVPPQKNSSPPDQSISASNASLIWPYDPNADHNLGFSTRTVTIIKVEPLPAGTTDINLLEADWNYVDEGKIIVYGAINPFTTSISGYKINDTNGNGKWNTGEKGISNWTIRLIGITGKGKNANVIRKETLTDATGFYKFENLSAGRYFVIEKLKKGFVPTSSPVKNIKLTEGKNSMDNNFTNRPVDRRMGKNEGQRDVDDYEIINSNIDKYKEAMD